MVVRTHEMVIEFRLILYVLLPNFSSMSIVSNALKLLADLDSNDKTERDEDALSRVIEMNEGGFLLSELGELSQLLPICFERLDSFPSMHELLLKLITLSSYPFLKEKASDEKNYMQNAAKFVQVSV